MRRQARVDANQQEIVAALRNIGASVQPIHQIGGGCPDILVGYRGRNIVMELKDGNKPPSARKLTADEIDWHSSWRGQVVIVETVAQAIKAVM